MKKRKALEVVTNCDNCGSCCRHMGTPPGYAAYYPPSGAIAEWAKESPDYELWLNLPVEVEAELREYYKRVQSGELLDRTRELADVYELAKEVNSGRLWMVAELLHKAANPQAAIPCLWYDEKTKRCKHYEHRPQTCREAIEPGDQACLATRRAFKIHAPKRFSLKNGKLVKS